MPPEPYKVSIIPRKKFPRKLNFPWQKQEAEPAKNLTKNQTDEINYAKLFIFLSNNREKESRSRPDDLGAFQK